MNQNQLLHTHQTSRSEAGTPPVHIALILGSHHALVYGCKLIERVINEGALCTAVVTQAALRGLFDEFSCSIDASTAETAHKGLSDFLELSELMKRQFMVALDDDPYALTDSMMNNFDEIIIAPASALVLQRALNGGDGTLASRLVGTRAMTPQGKLSALLSDKTLSPLHIEMLQACVQRGIQIYTCVGDYSRQPMTIDELADGVVGAVVADLKKKGSL